MDLLTSIEADTSFKRNFESKLIEHDEQHQGSQKKPWTKEKIFEVINNIRQTRVTMKANNVRTSMEYYWKSKYEIMTAANEEYLIFKKKSTEDPTIRIIPREEYFGVLEEVHKACGHGGRDKILHATKTKFYIPKKAVEIFVALCPTCKTKKNVPRKSIVTQPIISQDFNIKGQVDFMDFQYCPDDIVPHSFESMENLEVIIHTDSEGEYEPPRHRQRIAHTPRSSIRQDISLPVLNQAFLLEAIDKVTSTLKEVRRQLRQAESEMAALKTQAFKDGSQQQINADKNKKQVNLPDVQTNSRILQQIPEQPVTSQSDAPAPAVPTGNPPKNPPTSTPKGVVTQHNVLNNGTPKRRISRDVKRQEVAGDNAQQSIPRLKAIEQPLPSDNAQNVRARIEPPRQIPTHNVPHNTLSTDSAKHVPPIDRGSRNPSPKRYISKPDTPIPLKRKIASPKYDADGFPQRDVPRNISPPRLTQRKDDLQRRMQEPHLPGHASGSRYMEHSTDVQYHRTRIPQDQLVQVGLKNYNISDSSLDTLIGIIHNNLVNIDPNWTIESVRESCESLKRGRYNAWVLRCTRSLKAPLLTLEYITCGRLPITIVDYFMTRTCNKCQRFGHSETLCSRFDPICKNCGEVGHREDQCNSREGVCATCKQEDAEELRAACTGHRTFDVFCPVRMYEEKRAIVPNRN